jgi:hypothetical protein
MRAGAPDFDDLARVRDAKFVAIQLVEEHRLRRLQVLQGSGDDVPGRA